MIRRLQSVPNLQARLEQPDVQEILIGEFDPAEWIEQPNQFTLTNGYDLLLVKEWANQTFEIHWLFRNRGRKAINAGIDFLRYLYNKEGARIVVGTVPVSRRASRWFSRQVGGKSGGMVQTELGEMELFTQTREDFETQHGISP
jgi:hypothetical protein